MAYEGDASKSDVLLFRDIGEIDPPAERQEHKGAKNKYNHVPEPSYLLCVEDVWQPKVDSEIEETATKVVSRVNKAMQRRNLLKAKLRKQLTQILDAMGTVLVFTIMTFWALFFEEIRKWANLPPVPTDRVFATISFIFMILFFVEWGVRSWASYDEYFLSFFWWLDLVASASMLFDVLPLFVDDCNFAGSSFGMFASRLQSTTRLGRILRLLRVIRIVKIVSMLRQKRDGSVDAQQPSAVGKKLNEKIVQNVIISVLFIMVVLPYLQIEEVDYGLYNGLALLSLGKSMNLSSFNDMLLDYQFRIENVTSDNLFYYTPLIKMQMGGETLLLKDAAGNSFLSPQFESCFDPDATTRTEYLQDCPKTEYFDNVRCSFQLPVIYVPTWCEDSSCYARALFDDSDMKIKDARGGVVITIFIAILLFFAFMLYSQDVSSLVVRPIESMIDVVRKLAENPTLQLQNQTKSKYETEAVRVALAKIVGLMQLGFGGAGHEIIASNLANAEGQDLDLMRHGKKADCAYGFCDIRQFTDTVECLQDQVMLFTNSVGEIVHQACHDNRGEPNKNIGDAFLIVWRAPKGSQDMTKVVDGALTAFRRCVREIASSQTLQLVTNVEAIHKKFGQGKYRTKLGFGLHFGWSVEGPVGTPMKIDCSYLSPEVKISDRLEAATKIYSSNILMSGQFYDLLSDHIKVGIRLVDHITLKGGHKPFRVYADDRSNLWLKINPRLVEIYGAEAAYEQFSKTFHEGVDAFIKGDWMTATQKLEGATDFCPKDVPTKLLLKEMKKRSIDPVKPTAPVDWKGYHDSDV